MFAVMACAILAFTSYLLLQIPKYLVLSIESPSSYLPRGGWFSTSYATYVFPDSQHRFYVWRQEDDVSTQQSDPKSPFDTPQSIWKYFDSWLMENGWVPFEATHGGACTVFLPEASFLEVGSDGYRVYTEPDAKIFPTSPITCLAIWRDSENIYSRYHIVLVTANPSTLTAWNARIELGY
jgi:hypothetical protein